MPTILGLNVWDEFFGRTHFAIGVAIYRTENLPDATIPGKWERKWKMVPGPKQPTKWPQKWNKGTPEWNFGDFSILAAISGLEPFSIS